MIHIVILMFSLCKGTPLKDPDFISSWYELTSNDGGLNRVDIAHGLGEVPVYVHVQVKSTHEPNKGFIFPGIGLPLRDDDEVSPYSGIVYLYNERQVTVTAPAAYNHHKGSVVYTESSQYWEGPNRQDTLSASVRVRAWKQSSFPKPDFHSSGIPIGSKCNLSNDRKCFYEKSHNFNEYPSFIVVRTKLIDTDPSFDGFFSDSVGASHMVYDNRGRFERFNGYVIYGFNTNVVRIWTDSSKFGLLVHFDGYKSLKYIANGELEIIAWKSSSITQDLEREVQLGAIPGSIFEMETNYQLQTITDTESIVGIVWAESQDGYNSGFRFPGTGGMAYSTSQTASPCCYGGLTYAYTNTTLRVWKPGSGVDFGKVICIADIFAGGKFSQGSNNATAILKIWTVSSFGYACNNDEACSDDNAVCINTTCRCKSGFFETLSQCRKELTCSDEVPVIPDLGRRQRINIVNNDLISHNPVDDSFITESWYTAFYSGEQWLMPDSESVPIAGGCGSMNPVYMKGIHPSTDNLTEEGIDVEVRTLNVTNTAYSIKLRKCGQSIQYRLNSIMLKRFVFCIDSPLVQDHDGVFDEAPTGVNLGNLSVRVNLVNERQGLQDISGGKRYEPYLVFHCESDNMNNTTDHVYFTTYWFINGKLFHVHDPSEMIRYLTEQDLLDRSVTLGIDIYCGVQLSKSRTGYRTGMVESNTFYAGIQFQSKSIVIRKGETAAVVFQPTVPIGCIYSDVQGDECFKNVFLKPQDTFQEDTLIAVQTQQQSCGTRMKTLKKGEVWEAQSYVFNFTTIDSNYNDKYALRLQLTTDAEGHRIWRSYLLENIDVHVTYSDDIKHKLCYSHVDPHQRTADGYLYEHQYEGEYILYRNTKYAVDVQMKTTICNSGNAYCPCAVAIRAGGDVFMIKLCAGSKFIGYTSCTDNGILEVEQKSQFRYKVYTPIGTYIDILIRPHQNYYNLMNIDIYLAPKDIKATEGLCGFFDNNITNDLRKRDSLDFYPIDNSHGRHKHGNFSNDWRIQSRDINYLKLSNNETVPRWGTTNFCTCSQSEEGEPLPVCSPSLRVGSPTQDSFNDGKCLTYDSESESNERRRRFALSSRDESNTRNNKRGKRDIAETEAVAICKDVISNNLAVNEFKHRLIDIDIEGVIRECSYDILAEDDESWAAVYPDALIHLIESFNEKEPVYVAEHEEEIIKFISMSCPMNCSGHGICSVNGECQCTNGYFGPDCSLDKSDPLTIDDVYGDGICDLKDGSTCSCFTIQTISLLDEFVCNVTKTEILLNGDVEVNMPSILNGSYIDIFNGMCCVSEANQRQEKRIDVVDTFITQYDISISNDATTFGNSRTMTVYDSRCQDINIMGVLNVLMKNHTCFIVGQCKAENDTAENDECLLCNPAVGRYTWTRSCKTSDESTSITLLIAIPSGLVGICILIIVAIACVGYQRRSKRHTHIEQNREQINADRIDSAF